jgi:hypothetical protein
MLLSENAVYVQPSKSARSKSNSVKIANLLSIELMNYGIQLSADLRNSISKLNAKDAQSVATEILKANTMGSLTPPLFRNWEQRNAFTTGEIIVQLFAYVFQISGNDLYDPEFLNNLDRDFDYTKTLNLATKDDATKKFSTLATTRVPLDMASMQLVVQLAKTLPLDNCERIFSDEVRVAVIDGDGGCDFKSFKGRPTDVLKLFALRKNQNTLDMKLPVDVKFDALSWSERIKTLEFLESFGFEYLSEEMGKNRGAWSKFFNHIHAFGQKGWSNRFPNFMMASMASVQRNISLVDKKTVKGFSELILSGGVEVVSNKFVYRTFASRVESTLKNYKTFDQVVAVFGNKGSYVLNNLTSISNKIKKADSRKFVELVRGFLTNAPVKTLFSILSIDVNAEWRVIDVKGSTKIETANYSSVIGDIQGDIKIALHERFGFEGKVTVDKELATLGVPFLTTSSQLSRGTRYSFTDDEYLYFFMKWIQPENRTTDLDHSLLYFDADWNSQHVSFSRQVDTFIRHGGDITSAPAPHGASEYSRVDLKLIPKAVKYIVPSVFVYRGTKLSLNDEAYAGFYFGDNDSFSLKQEHTRYDFTQPSGFNVPFIIDVENREIVVVDYNQETSGNVVQSAVCDIKNLISATNSKNYITVEDLAEILSGDKDTTSLNISNDSGDGIVAPQDLFSLFA